MQAGRLNRRIAIERRAATTDAAGQPTGAWAHLGYLWADVAHDTGKAAIRRAAESSVPYTQYSFMVRFGDAGALGVTDGDRVLHDGAYYDVKGITRDVKDRDAAYLVCERGGNEG